MYASIFRLELDGEPSSRDRGRHGRALAAELAALPGFVAFIALEAEDGAVSSLCICEDAAALAEAQLLAAAWQGETNGPNGQSYPSWVTGRVIVQHGL